MMEQSKQTFESTLTESIETETASAVIKIEHCPTMKEEAQLAVKVILDKYAGKFNIYIYEHNSESEHLDVFLATNLDQSNQ